MTQVDFNFQAFGHDSLLNSSDATVKLLLHYLQPFGVRDKAVHILDRFIQNEQLNSAAVVDENNNPVGMLNRGKLIEAFIRPFAKDLYHKAEIAQFMDPNPIIVDIHTTIDDLARIVIDSGMQHMATGFIITQNGVYAGMGTGHDLLQEITNRKQQQLYYLAHYDPLTGLANRLLFHDRLQHACLNARRHKHSVGLVFIDLDRFKYVNDTLGHAVGDLLLQSVGKRLSGCVRECDTVARLGGDEFVLILENIRDTGDAVRVSNSVIRSMQQPLLIEHHEIHITGSLGIAFFPQHDETVDGLIRKADAAMYEAKQSGRNMYLIYSEEFSQHVLERMSLETQLRTALEKQEFSLFYQPQIHLPSHRVIGVEALLRWHHPELGTVSPSKFIPIAEETGLIMPIGEWLFREACRQQRSWIQSGLPPLRISVNISAVQFRDQNFNDMVKAAIAETSVDPQYIELELTEGMIMTDAEYTVESLRKLKKLGIKLAIDDFGTGYSSLNYLRMFPIDRIKIDQSFVLNLNTTPANEAIVRAIVGLGNNLGLELIAEGVETQEEMECISSYGCHEAQGYLFSRPLPASDFKEWYREFDISRFRDAGASP